MSSEADAWAKAQRCPSPRAKAVLKSLASYANQEGRSWVSLAVLLIETDLGTERTVQRGLADLKRAGLIEDTGDTKVHLGRVFPIYQLALEQGPANTRERLAQERAAAAQEAGLGVTPVSPQEARGDMGVTPRGDTGDALGVTPVSPKLKGSLNLTPLAGAREAALRAGFEALEAAVLACLPLMVANGDRDRGFEAWCELAAAGEPVDQLADCARRMAAHPTTKRRDFAPIGLDKWLRRGQWRGWTAEAVAAGEGGAAAAPAAKAVWVGPPGLRAALALRAGGEAALTTTLDLCGWDEAAQTITPRTGFARDRLREWMRGLAEAEGITLAESAKATVSGVG